MKKAMIVILIVILLITGIALSVPFVNDHSAKKVAAELAALPLPRDTVAVEIVYGAGKFVGNGNGMQYFGALLLKSDLSLEELTDHYKSMLPYGGIKEQRGAEIEIINGKLSFKTEIKEDGYYVVYNFGEGVSLFSKLDIRGH